MNWTVFQEKAKKVHSKFFFKRTMDGYEIWDIAMKSGPGMPRKYKCMIIPYGTNSVGFSMMLARLKRGNWNRRLARQMANAKRAIQSTETYREMKAKIVADMARAQAKDYFKFIRKSTLDDGLSVNRMRLGMKGVDWDDTKKVIRKMMEEKGAYK